MLIMKVNDAIKTKRRIESMNYNVRSRKWKQEICFCSLLLLSCIRLGCIGISDMKYAGCIKKLSKFSLPLCVNYRLYKFPIRNFLMNITIRVLAAECLLFVPFWARKSQFEPNEVPYFHLGA